MNIIKNYIDSCNNLAEEFANKHDLQFDKNSWIGDRYDVIEISDYYIDITTIFIDIKNEVSINTFFEWHDYQLENYKNNNKGLINYNSWIMGLRPENNMTIKLKEV